MWKDEWFPIPVGWERAKEFLVEGVPPGHETDVVIAPLHFSHWLTTLAALVVLGMLSWWPKRAIRSCFDRVVTPLQQLRNHHSNSHNHHDDQGDETRRLQSLLETLREIPSLWEILEPPEDRRKKKWQLVFRQLHEFPGVLRHYMMYSAHARWLDDEQRIPIEFRERLDAMGDAELGALEERVEETVAEFLFGFLGHDDDGNLYGYYGLDSRSVTEDELEVVLRCFPELLKQQYATRPETRNLHGACPVFALTCHEDAVPFVPIFAKIGAEVGGFRDDERGGLACDDRKHNVLMELLCNTVRRKSFGQEPSRELDENSLAALVRLREMGMVTKQDESDLVVWHLCWELDHRSFEFIESRVRLVVDEWNPALLRNCEQFGSAGLLATFLLDPQSKTWVRMFRLLLELGMSHYPMELGFVFHGCALQFVCERYGRERALRIVDDEISGILRRDNGVALHCLILGAASNAYVSLDAVYMLLRRDPIAMLPKSFRNST